MFHISSLTSFAAVASSLVTYDPDQYLSNSTQLVFATAALSRLFILLLGLTSYILIEPYDTSAILNHKIGILQWPAHWDGVYFTRIAAAGYEYEEFHAFFPLYPLAIRFLSSTLFIWLKPFINEIDLMTISGLIISNF